jgi:hypothetical protein
MIADYAIHDIGSGNPHAHVMLTMRKVNKNGFLNKKPENGMTQDLLRCGVDHGLF